jgi:hypothetical protein
VSAGEGALKLQLGTSLANLVVTKASFDIEAKKNVVVKAVTFDSVGGAPSRTFYLVTGKSKNYSQYSSLPNADLNCTSKSDSGPDSGASDNCRWNIDAQWTKIELSALTGEFGLEGGADGTGPTTFDVGTVGDGFLSCPSNPTQPNDIPAKSDSSGLTVSGSRFDNVDDPLAAGGAPACVPVPYALSTTCPSGQTGSCTNFQYDPLSQGTNMAFTFHVEWPLEAIPPTGIKGIQPTLQFFINGNPVGLELNFCPEISPQFGADGEFTGITDALPADQDPAPGTQAGCLVKRTVEQVGNQVKVVEDAYVQGDYVMVRAK